jgi:Kdo2-lipid IVA 3' secondary acyltransferase
MSDAARTRRAARLAQAGGVLLRALASTWRVSFTNPQIVSELRMRGQPFIYLLWHGTLLPLTWVHRNRNVVAMISEHSDGEIIARLVQSIGYRTVRGSTSRGAARALLGACRVIEEGACLAVTPDGPRGPAESVAPGAAIIAHRTGAPMVPVALHASSAWRLNSWDQFMIPTPFARLTVAYGDPIQLDAASARDAARDTELIRAGITLAARRAASA